MRKMRSLLAIAVLLLAGCTAYTVQYNMEMDSVSRSGLNSADPPDALIIKTSAQYPESYSYEDSSLCITWTGSGVEFGFVLRNKTMSTMRVLWDGAVIMDPEGRSQRVIHSGVKLIERDQAQVPSVILAGGILDDMVVPAKNFEFVPGQYGGWRTTPMLDPCGFTPTPADTSAARMHIGKKFRVMLPIEVNGEVTEYTFGFVVDDVWHSKTSF